MPASQRRPSRPPIPRSGADAPGWRRFFGTPDSPGREGAGAAAESNCSRVTASPPRAAGVLLDERVPRTLDGLEERLAGCARPGDRVEIWLFEGAARRRAAERGLRGLGVTAVLRSAYKPLVQFFLEEAGGALRRATIRYPVHPAAHPRRFLLEAYPLAPLLRGVETAFVAADGPSEAAGLHYRVEVERRTGERETHHIFAPNRVREDHLGERVLCPSGWLRVTGPDGGAPRVDEPIATDYESIFEHAMAAVRAASWGDREPYFERLVVRADVPDAERRLDVGEERLSPCEAMHEELYFSILEFFKDRAGRGVDDRTIRPGQIVPDVRETTDTPGVRVQIESAEQLVQAEVDRSAHLRRVQIESAEQAGGQERAYRTPARAPAPLETAASPLELIEIWEETAALPGRTIAAESRQGRPVRGVYRAGRRPPIVITAGQHANETTGVVGALRAARALAADSDASFAVIPAENPDGYALHRWLCERNPRHMHHAARYTALGDDLGARVREPWYERRARLEAQQMSGARLHINLHGYPSHEWTRPLTGYLPRGFQTWSIPKGFYLILRHHRAWAPRVPGLLEGLTAALARVPGLGEFNRAQLAAYEIHVGERPDRILHDIPCEVAEDDQAPFPLTLVTEFPDETIYGDLFVLAHTVQMETVLAAEAIYAGLRVL
jgi:hypothetical protein